MKMFVKVVSAEYMEDFKIDVLFDNGVKKVVDFHFLLFVEDYPVFRPLVDVEVFKNFEVTDTLEWLHGTIDIAPNIIYRMG
jgi:Protein of unknown function (DUF2442)